MTPTATNISNPGLSPAVKAKPVAAPTASLPSMPPLVDLYSGSGLSSQKSDEELRKGIIQGLRGYKTYIVPGSVDNLEDRQFAYKRTLPTTILYSEKGLLIYDRLVEEPEYYLWSAEKNILETHAKDISLRIFGHQTSAAQQYEQLKSNDDVSQDDEKQQQQGHDNNDSSNRWPRSAERDKERWGDHNVGRHNGGVNGEEGMDGEQSVGCASLVELGAGSLRKTVHLIRGLQGIPPRQGADKDAPVVQYYALDLDKAELVRTLEQLHKQEAKQADANTWTVLDGKVGINGMWATYDQGLDFIGKGGLAQKGSEKEEGKRCLVWLGSSIGNFNRRAAAEFLETAAKSSLRPGDTMLISVDRRNEPEAVAKAYHDANGVTRDFILEGITHADKILGGHGVLDPTKFEYKDRYNNLEGRHESYYQSLCHQKLKVPGEEEDIEIEEGELIHVESSYKYNEREILDVFDYAGLRVVERYSDDQDRYDVWLVERPAFHFSSTRLMTGSRQDMGKGLTVEQANGQRGSWEFDSDGGAGSNSIGEPTVHSTWGMPARADWEQLWKAWDTVTLTMIPKEMLHEKPIDLRHICLFYIGHIPAFCDIMLARTLNEPHLNNHFSEIFERGIDPHLDDETQCNPHSEVPTKPEDWPTLEELLEYRGKVAKRVETIYDDVAQGKRVCDRRLARLLWLTLEHKALHLETLLYMLVQSPRTLPPRGFTAPDWKTLARQWDSAWEKQGGQAADDHVLNFKAAEITLGHNDDDAQDAKFVASRPSSNVNEVNEQLGKPEFGWDNESPARKVSTDAFTISALPITNSQYLEYLKATDSQEVPSSWVYVAEDSPSVKTAYGAVPMRAAQHWPVQASAAQLEEFAKWKGGRLPTHAELRRFLDATSGPNCTDRPGTNVGFRNWHPVPPALSRPAASASPDASSQQQLPGHNGGVWEWTSTPFINYEGFKPSALYPGYSADFFDGKHNVVLGGSWATTPSIAGRRTFVNSYQAAYPYVFAGARVVYDRNTQVKPQSLSPSSSRSTSQVRASTQT